MTELATSLTFYVGVLEFRVLVARPVERFAYLERGGVELMLQEAAGPGRRFRTAPLTYPFGGGVNFQLRVEEWTRFTPAPSRGLSSISPSTSSRVQSREATYAWVSDAERCRADVAHPSVQAVASDSHGCGAGRCRCGRTLNHGTAPPESRA